MLYRTTSETCALGIFPGTSTSAPTQRQWICRAYWEPTTRSLSHHTQAHKTCILVAASGRPPIRSLAMYQHFCTATIPDTMIQTLELHCIQTKQTFTPYRASPLTTQWLPMKVLITDKHLAIRNPFRCTSEGLRPQCPAEKQHRRLKCQNENFLWLSITSLCSPPQTLMNKICIYSSTRTNKRLEKTRKYQYSTCHVTMHRDIEGHSKARYTADFTSMYSKELLAKLQDTPQIQWEQTARRQT